MKAMAPTLWQLVVVTPCLLALTPAATAVPESPFTFAAAGVWTDRGDPVLPEIRQTSTDTEVRVEVGTAPAAYMKAKASFGSIGLAMQSAQADRAPAGGGLWSDGFVIDGGSGTASVTLSTRLVGSIVGEAELEYTLFVSPAPFDLQVVLDEIYGLGSNTLPNATRVLHMPEQDLSGVVDRALVGSLSFTYSQPFYLLAGFGGELIAGNSMDFYNSADFGITVPSGATLRSFSHTAYATAVPEPATVLLLAAGLAGIVLRRGRAAVAG